MDSGSTGRGLNYLCFSRTSTHKIIHSHSGVVEQPRSFRVQRLIYSEAGVADTKLCKAIVTGSKPTLVAWFELSSLDHS